MGMQVRTAVDMFLGNVGKNWATFWSSILVILIPNKIRPLYFGIAEWS